MHPSWGWWWPDVGLPINAVCPNIVVGKLEWIKMMTLRSIFAGIPSFRTHVVDPRALVAYPIKIQKILGNHIMISLWETKILENNPIAKYIQKIFGYLKNHPPWDAAKIRFQIMVRTSNHRRGKALRPICFIEARDKGERLKVPITMSETTTIDEVKIGKQIVKKYNVYIFWWVKIMCLGTSWTISVESQSCNANACNTSCVDWSRSMGIPRSRQKSHGDKNIATDFWAEIEYNKITETCTTKCAHAYVSYV